MNAFLFFECTVTIVFVDEVPLRDTVKESQWLD